MVGVVGFGWGARADVVSGFAGWKGGCIFILGGRGVRGGAGVSRRVNTGRRRVGGGRDWMGRFLRE